MKIHCNRTVNKYIAVLKLTTSLCHNHKYNFYIDLTIKTYHTYYYL